MHFGKALLAQRYEPWADHYLDYARLKTVLEQNDDAATPRKFAAASLKFAELFDAQVEHVVYFFLDQQGMIARELHQLRSSIRRGPPPEPGSEDDDDDDNDSSQYYFSHLRNLASDLLHLIEYVDLNVTAIRKILKKHDRVVKGHRRLSPVYLGYNHVILSPLFEEHGGLEALSKTIQDAFDELNIPLQDEPQQQILTLEEEPPLRWRGYGTSNESSAELMQATAARQKHEVVIAIQVAFRRLKKTSDFVRMLASQMLMSVGGEESSQDGSTAEQRQYEKRRISNWLNLMSTFLHLTDYYIVAPGCGSYAEKLGGTASLAGLIIGMNSVAALVSTVLYSWWTSYSYRGPIMCATTCQILGCIIYAMALPMSSLKLVVLGRLFSGFGSARALNRRYIADTYPARERTAASAAFVTAGALGTSAGPAFAACLYFVVPETSNNPYWQVENAPCWSLSIVWSVYLVILYFYFQEPARSSVVQTTTAAVSKVEMSSHDDPGESLRLLEHQGSGSASQSEGGRVQPLWQNIPTCCCFCIYFVLKFILESLLSSTATLTDFYFDWDGSLAGTYLAILGLLVLPANWLVAFVAQSYDDRELIVAIEIFMLLGCLCILDYTAGSGYTAVQYVFGSIIIFVSTNALEGPTMSLLSKTIPRVYSRGLLNVGLLATEAGTLGRAVGDVILTMCGASGLEYILNHAFGAMVVLSLLSIGVTRYFYKHLEPSEKDD